MTITDHCSTSAHQPGQTPADLRAENQRLRWQIEQMQRYLEAIALNYECYEEQYREGGDNLLASLYRARACENRAALAYMAELQTQPLTLEELRAMVPEQLLGRCSDA